MFMFLLPSRVISEPKAFFHCIHSAHQNVSGFSGQLCILIFLVQNELPVSNLSFEFP